MNTPELPTESISILVVDDTQDNVRLLSTILSEKGYQVRKALNGKRALATVEENPPDLILLDVMMPEMNGYQVCQSLKASPLTESIPVIFLSALNEISDKVMAFEVGGVDYITKPFQSQEVLARVATHLTIINQRQVLQEQAKQLQEKNQTLEKEIKERERVEKALIIAKQTSENLLLNILPKTIADRLKNSHDLIAERFESATVMFADLVNFTPLAASISPLDLVKLLNEIFSRFDKLTETYNLEKIKTIGDAYMVAGGLPLPQENHTAAMAEMALKMLTVIEEFKTDNGQPFELRIGIHTGPVIAGVIGRRKFIYDLWGDTVNVASRMESQGLPGAIQVSSAVWEILKDDYAFEPRGMIEVKGKGEMMTYWLKGHLN